MNTRTAAAHYSTIADALKLEAAVRELLEAIESRRLVTIGEVLRSRQYRELKEMVK